jgi:MoaD family protein
MKFQMIMGNQSEIELEIKQHGTLGDILDELSNRFGKEFDSLVYNIDNNTVKNSVMILLNGASYLNFYDRLHREVKEGDRIILCPVMTGG